MASALTARSYRAVAPQAGASLARLHPLFEEIGDLKRIQSAARQGSIASRLFADGWRALLDDVPADIVARDVTAAVLCATRLGDIDSALLRNLDVRPAALHAILSRAFDAVAAPLDSSHRTFLREGIDVKGNTHDIVLPPFVAQLQAQPRAGLTCPGAPRIVLEPPESHADHCLVVAVYGVLLSPHYDADPATVFVAALAHHLHNASLPDSGFAGEVLLGQELDQVVEAATARALRQIAPPIREVITNARRILPDAESPEGRAFHAADVIDRVLQIAQHLRAATLTMQVALDTMHLVHDGPVKPFHEAVLAEINLS